MPTAYAGDEIQLESLIDLETYPIHLLNSPIRRELVEHCRVQFNADGCSVIKGLILETATAAMAAEANRLMHLAYRTEDRHNPYFTAPSDNVETPEGFLQIRTSGYINSDKLEQQSILRQLYDSDVLTHFISECVGDKPIYRWADTIARSPYGVMKNDDYFPWHFDGNDFTTTILVQNSEAGGVFEYIPNVRKSNDEQSGRVMGILKGDREGVKQLNLQRGDMQLFKGRYSMHRVTQVTGETPRIIAIPAYVTDPYQVTNPHHVQCLYGKVLPIHFERNLSHTDSLVG